MCGQAARRSRRCPRARGHGHPGRRGLGLAEPTPWPGTVVPSATTATSAQTVLLINGDCQVDRTFLISWTSSLPICCGPWLIHLVGPRAALSPQAVGRGHARRTSNSARRPGSVRSVANPRIAKTSLCQVPDLIGIDRPARVVGWRSGPGVASPKCRRSGCEPAALDAESFPGCPPGPSSRRRAARRRRRRRVDGVADPPLEGAERFLAGLAFGDLAVVVGAAGRCA